MCLHAGIKLRSNQFIVLIISANEIIGTKYTYKKHLTNLFLNFLTYVHLKHYVPKYAFEFEFIGSIILYSKACYEGTY